jgi:hypothetical protein
VELYALVIKVCAAFLAVPVALGGYEAYQESRCAFGWIVSIISSVFGAMIGGPLLPTLVAVAMDPGIVFVRGKPLVGIPAGDRWLYLMLACGLVGVIGGSTLSLRLVGRFR